MNTDDSWAELEFSIGRRLFYFWALTWGCAMTVVSTSGYLLTQFFLRRVSVFRWWSVFWARSMFFGVGLRIEQRQLGHLDCDTSYVFASNHQILIDIPLTALAISCPFGFVAKSDLARVPFLGAALRYSPSVFVNPSNPRKSYESIKRAGEHIRAGTSVIIFPEGARTYQKALIPFQRGAFLLALEAGVPIVPVTILDAYRVFNEKLRLARPGLIRVVVGNPIPLAEMSRSDLPELMDRVKNEIESQFDFAFDPDG
ncbi:MAG: lysophospholipid acyltransferase family protein [Bacteroidetes bacterium]|nr:lysophospholipid acyltransferase family protein [Bacteroidota bacterium]